jgi:hypothetical protein
MFMPLGGTHPQIVDVREFTAARVLCPIRLNFNDIQDLQCSFYT